MAADHSWLDERPPRLGDLIDDHCPRCKRLMNHAIASFMGDKVVKVICQTCYSEHPYLEGKEKKKKPKATPFDQVLSKVSSSSGTSTAPAGKKPNAKSAARPLIRHKATSPRKKK
ncbi:MAG: hypothetical protein M1423_05565 [Acidobacteria bacterium]|nr:hypothetical protein [Acidobacteriota bacterium]